MKQKSKNKKTNKVKQQPISNQQTLQTLQKVEDKETNWKWVAIGLIGLCLFLTGRAIYLILKAYS